MTYTATINVTTGIFKRTIEELNGHEEMTIELPNSVANRALVAADQSADLVWTGPVTLFEGTCTGAKHTRGMLECIVYNEAYEKLQRHQPFNTPYVETAASAVLTALGAHVGIAVAWDAGSDPDVSIRFDYANCMDVLIALAEATGNDYWTTTGPLTIHIGTRGSAKGAVSALEDSTRVLDRSRQRNSVRVRGVDATGNVIYGTASTGGADRYATFTEKKVSDQATLDALAATKLAELNTDTGPSPLAVSLLVGNALFPGDTVTLNEAHLQLVGDYRLWKVERLLDKVIIFPESPDETIEKAVWDTRKYEDLGIYIIVKITHTDQIADGLFDGIEGINKFAADFWQGTEGLTKFIDDFFTYDQIEDAVTGFWGSITDRTNWLWNDILDTAANLFNAISDVANFDQWVTNFWGGVKTFTQLIGGAGATISDFFTALYDRTILLWGDITGAISAFWGAITDRANWLWGDISGAVADFWSALTDRANWAWGDISGAISDFFGALTDRTNLLWEDVLDTAANLFGAISNVANFGQWVTNFWGGVKSFTDIIGGAGATIANFFTALFDRANWLWGDISGNIAAFWAAITDRANWLWSDISGNIAAFWGAITDRASWAWGDISGNIAAFWGAVTDRANWLYSDISDTFANWKSSITDTIGWLWSEITVTWQNILDTISSWANMLTGLGNFTWSLITVTWQNIMTTISSWANIISQVGGLTTLQVAGVLTSWATLTNASALGDLIWDTVTKTGAQVVATIANWSTVITGLGNLAWAYLTKTWQNIMSTISSWTNILSQVGAMSVAQITTTLTSWANIISSLGNLAWGYVTHTVANILDTIGSWANIVSEFGNLAWAQVTKTAANILSTLGAISAAAIQGLLTSWEQLTGGSALGDITAGEGDVVLDAYGITFKGQTLRFWDTNEVLRGTIFGVTTGAFSIYAPGWILLNPSSSGVKVNAGPMFPGADGEQSLGTVTTRWKYYTPSSNLAGRPASDDTTVGMFWRTREADPNDKDILWICMQNDASGYEWVQLGIST